MGIGVHRVYQALASLVSMARGKLSQAMATELPSIQLALVKLTELLKVCLGMVLVSMAKEMLSQVMDMVATELLQFLSLNLIMAMDITLNLTPMDITLEVMERERLSQDMVLDMVLLLHPSTHMEVPVPDTELHKDFPAMDIMDMERDQLNQVMESVLLFQLLVSHLFSKADHITMDHMVIILTMFMERDLLIQDTSMVSIQANSMFQNLIPAMESMLPTPIKDC